jgi:hypothetical protein
MEGLTNQTCIVWTVHVVNAFVDAGKFARQLLNHARSPVDKRQCDLSQLCTIEVFTLYWDELVLSLFG